MRGSNIRSSGIPAVGDLHWGAHFSVFYRDSTQDLFDVIAPFVLAGLAQNEDCLWIATEPLGVEQVRRRLRPLVPDFERRVATSQLEIVSFQEWYERLKKADKSPGGELIEGWAEREKQALERGREGLRFTAKPEWVKKDWKGLVQYEAKMNQWFSSRRIIGNCAYGLIYVGGEDALDVLDVIENHRFTLARPEQNWSIIESSSLKLANEELRELIEKLEQRVQERTAELESALRVKDEFLSVASHELKTPVTSLQLHVDGLMRTRERLQLSENLLSRLYRVREQGKRIATLVDKLLDVSRTDQGQLPLQLEEVDLEELVLAVVEQMGQQAEKAGCKVSVTVNGRALGRWDKTRLEQVVFNLLSNAFKYAPGRPVKVTVGQVDQRAILKVRDEGIGIALQDQHRIFDRFTQVSPGPRSSGFGVGLWIVRQTVEAFHGTVGVMSEPGHGSTFTVTLPLNPVGVALQEPQLPAPG